MVDTPHSEFILSDARDDWWNHDFLALMAARLDIGRARRILDVGAGHGHWGHTWVPHLAADAIVVGVDKEPEWIEEADRRSRRLGLDGRFSYRLGTAEALPVPDASFDMVTCQTVLMHVGDPAAVVAEMTRALAPGGLLLLAEPNNLATILTLDSAQRQLSVGDVVALTRFHLTCNQGRRKLGEGDYAIGDRLPQLLVDAGLAEVRVHINDHAAPVFQGIANHPGRWRGLEDKVRNIEGRAWLWSREEAERLYLAGGGSAAEFAEDYRVFLADARAFVSAINAASYSTTGGAQHYLISARRR